MQGGIRDFVNKGKKRRRTLETQTQSLNASLNRNSQAAPSRLISIINNANSALHKKPKLADESITRGENNQPTACDQGSMHGGQFTQRGTLRPSFTPQPTGVQLPNFQAPLNRHAPRSDVQGSSKQSSQSSDFFARSAELRAEAEAAWHATAGARKGATSRMQREKAQEEAGLPAKLAAEKERLAAEFKQKQDALRAKKEEEQRKRTEHNIRRKRSTGDGMWPQNEWDQYAFGGDYAAWRESKGPEFVVPGASAPKPACDTAGAGSGAEAAGAGGGGSRQAPTADAYHRRDFNFDDPDDCWGYCGGSGGSQQSYSDGNSGGNCPKGAEEESYGPWDQWDGSGEEEEEEASGGAREWAPGSSDYGPRGAEGRGGMDDHWAGHNGDNGDWFKSGEWEEFKRNWHKNSRQHHNQWYYTNENDNQNGTAGARGRGTAAQRKESRKICEISAAAAARRAIEAAQRPATDSDQAEEALREQIESAVRSAAEHAGHDVAVFAMALNIEVDMSQGVEYAKKMAKKGLLMTYHPDKLANAATREQWLGACVTQILNAKVK